MQGQNHERVHICLVLNRSCSFQPTEANELKLMFVDNNVGERAGIAGGVRGRKEGDIVCVLS